MQNPAVLQIPYNIGVGGQQALGSNTQVVITTGATFTDINTQAVLIADSTTFFTADYAGVEILSTTAFVVKPIAPATAFNSQTINWFVFGY